MTASGPVSIFDPLTEDTVRIVGQAKKLYFFHGLVDLRFFFSIYDGNSDCVVCVPNWVAGCEILTNIVGADHIISIGEPPSVSGKPLESDEKDKLFFSLREYAHAIKSVFLDVNPAAEAIFFNEFSMFPWFVLVGMFRKKGVNIKYVNIHPWLRMVPKGTEKDRQLQREYDAYFEELSTVAGVGISPMLYESTLREEEGGWVTELFTAEGTGLTQPMERHEFEVLSWSQLGQRFDLIERCPSESAILFIETPFRPYWPSVDIGSTYLRVAKHFLLTLDSDIEIHFKPHFENLSFDPFELTPIGDRVIRLPSYIPAELFMPNYKKIFFFGTNAANESVSGELYCMRDLIDFGDERERLRFETLTFAKYKDNEVNFIFVQ